MSAVKIHAIEEKMDKLATDLLHLIQRVEDLEYAAAEETE
jgi:hypothetical protein